MSWMKDLLVRLSDCFPQVERKQLDMIVRLGSQSLLASAQSMTQQEYWDSDERDDDDEKKISSIPLATAVPEMLALLEPMFPQIDRNTLIYVGVAAAHAMAAANDSYHMGTYQVNSPTNPGSVEFVINGVDQYLHCLHQALGFALFGSKVDYDAFEDYLSEVWWHGIKVENLPMYQRNDYGNPPETPENPWQLGQRLMNSEARVMVYLERPEQVVDLFIRHSAFVIDEQARQRMITCMNDMFEEHPDKKWRVFITNAAHNLDAVRALIQAQCWNNAPLDDILPGNYRYKPVPVSAGHHNMWQHDAEAFAAKFAAIGADVVISDEDDLPKRQWPEERRPMSRREARSY